MSTPKSANLKFETFAAQPLQERQLASGDD